MSADGRYVAFASGNHGLGVSDGVGRAILVRDTLTGAVTVVSRQDGRDGPPIPGSAFAPQISANRRRVAFEVSDGVGDEGGQIYLRDIPAGRTYRIDRADGPNGAPANGGSFEPTISDDGRRVAFLTVATNLGDGDTDPARWTRTCATSTPARRCWSAGPTARPARRRAPARATRRSAAAACAWRSSARPPT